MAVRYLDSMQDFMETFATESACRAYLISIRWPEGFSCPHCKNGGYWQVGRGDLKCRRCRRFISVTSGTVFQDSHLSLRLWFQAVWLMVSQKNGVSALGLSRALGMKREKTGWELLTHIRGGLIRKGQEKLSGTVEVDEVFLGGVKPGKRGRGALGKVLILVAVEDKGTSGFGRIRITIIDGASSATLVAAIKAMVEPGSTIRTDLWKSYPAIEKHGYKHRAIEHESALGEDATPLVHRIASLVKRWLLGTHHGRVEQEHLQGYLNEYVFRFNRRRSGSRGKLFYRLIQGLMGVEQA